jgi:hypothetical protein
MGIDTTEIRGSVTRYVTENKTPLFRFVCALLNTIPAGMFLVVVLVLYRGIWIEYWPAMFRVLVSYFSRSILNVLRGLLKSLLVELRYLVGWSWRDILLSF